MDIILQLNSQTAGRDKIIRLLQYCVRASWYYSPSRNQSTDVLKSLEYTFSSFRKLLRFGRCLDGLYSTILAMNYPDLSVRIPLALSRFANALFLLADHIIWLSRAGVLRVNLDKWTSLSHSYWLCSLVMNLIRDFYEIIALLKQQKISRVSKMSNFGKNELSNSLRPFLACLQRKDVVLDTVKNACDLFIPLSALGYTKLSPGVVGILGSVSSAIGLYCLIFPMFKLPAT